MKRLALIIVAVATALLGAALAHGESVQQGNLRVGFDAAFAPHSLPRAEAVPVRVSLDGTVATADGSRPPELRRISIALNRYGRLTTHGLPSCSPGALQAVSSTTALQRCRPALVGHGRFGANLALSGENGEKPVHINGKVLGFNSTLHGRTAIAVYIGADSPVKASVVLMFKIARLQHGSFGTVLSTRIPEIAGSLGYVTDVSLSFGRRYTYRGRRLSFLSASCAAPSGFPGAIFSFARGSFAFANGQHLTSTVIRDCHVR
jgi:hypothetical protein